jgi:hypothetical protein
VIVMTFDPGSQLTQTITAIGGLGTAAFGLLEAAKPVFPFINWLGFPRIRRTVRALAPHAATAAAPQAHGGQPPAPSPAINALPQSAIVETLKSNWVNGTDLTAQKAIAKSLIKLHFSADNAETLAAATSVDSAILTSVAKKNAAGKPLEPSESDVFARFDLIVTAMLDDCYQRADQFYRNWMRGLAALIAVALALAGGRVLIGTTFWQSADAWVALLVGLLATPLAPVAKDLSTALATAVDTMQSVKKVIK